MVRRRRPPFVRYSDDEDTVPDEEVKRTRSDAIDRAERTLNIQRERFDRIDEKASKMLRFVAVLSGAVFAVLGLGPAVNPEKKMRAIDVASTSTQFALVMAGIGFVGTIFFAAVTYVTTRFRSSFSARATAEVRETRFGTEPYQKLLLEAYGEAIRRNRPRVTRNRRQFIITICSLVLAVSFLTVAAGILIVQPAVRVRQAAIAMACALFIAFVVWVISEMERHV